MSKADLQRLSAALDADPGLSEEFTSLGDDAALWMRHANTKGFHLTSEEAVGLASSFGELSDEDLEGVAGGWNGEGEGP